MKYLIPLSVALAAVVGFYFWPPQETPTYEIHRKHKPLASMWVSIKQRFVLDLTDIEIGRPKPIKFHLANGAICECELRFDGSQTGGTFKMSKCEYAIEWYGKRLCHTMDREGTFSKMGHVLKLCGDPDVYECDDYVPYIPSI